MLFIIFLGFLFAAIMVYASLNKFDVISGAATLTDFTVPKVMLIAIGLGMFILALTIDLGLADYHIKPFVTGGLIIGGLLFGTGMAILGYCPGTLPISMGEGSLDALFGIIGGIIGGVVYTILSPALSAITGPNLGNLSLYGMLGEQKWLFYLIVIAFGSLLIYFSFYLNRKEKSKSKKWIYAGIMFALLNTFVFMNIGAGRPIGASTSYPYFGDLLTGLTNNSYYNKIKTPGHWELWFLAGAFLGGLIISLFRKEFKISLMTDKWIAAKGQSKTKKILWSLTAGFILVFGARMAGGCTSGHILSGGMQFAFSSLFFSVFVFVGLLITGKYFYKK